jgi:hypothetical protein
MHLINSHRFLNDKLFETYFIERHETEHNDLPECDVIGFAYDDGNSGNRFLVMRPDEALILARLLIDAVYQVTEGYATDTPRKVVAYESVKGERREVFRAGE